LLRICSSASRSKLTPPAAPREVDLHALAIQRGTKGFQGRRDNLVDIARLVVQAQRLALQAAKVQHVQNQAR